MEILIGIIILLVITFVAFRNEFDISNEEKKRDMRRHNQIVGKVGRSLGRSITGRGPYRWRF